MQRSRVWPTRQKREEIILIMCVCACVDAITLQITHACIYTIVTLLPDIETPHWQSVLRRNL